MADPTYYDLSVTGTTLASAITKAGTALQSTDIGSIVQGYDANTVKKNSTQTFSASQIIEVADNTNPALRVTQTGTGDCLRIEDSANPDSTPFVIDANGDIVCGYGSSIAGAFSDKGAIQVAQTTGRAVFQAFTFRNATSGSYIYLNKSRSGTAGTNTAVQSGDSLGGILFAGGDGTTYHRAASIESIIDATPGTNDMPGRLVFSTTPDGSTSPTEAFRVNCAQDLGIGVVSPSARVHVVKTTEQLRLGYDATKYLSITVDSAGDALLAPVGVLKFGTWTSNADAAVNGYISIKDAAGNVRKLATIA